MSDVKFIRKNGRIIPLKGKGSAPKGVSKRYGAEREKPKVKSLSPSVKASLVGVGALAGAAAMGSGLLNRFVGAGMGAALGGVVGSTKYTKKGKGESNKQMAARVAGKSKTGLK